MNIKDKQAVVTGGASGLGAATARQLHASGASVLIADLNADQGQALARELGRAASFARTDVSDEGSVRQALGQLETVHILVNCAGIGAAEKIVGKQGVHDLGRFENVIRVNLIGTFNTLRLAAQRMVGNEPDPGGERGVIINTASVAAYDGQIGQAAYAASKGGIVSLTLPAARDLCRRGVRVVAIAPGIFDTPLLAALPEKARLSLGEQVPFPSRLGQPPEYAALVRHIIENTMINGEVIRLDGALRMAPR